ncbi:hypothetical protein PQG02_35230 (plasmid) [Nostoc sp. UHCC 0926]|uniref:hypothetical protein n=1 Tax=Nostoc sp. UHCC 0926 TaxID=3025190 RepID=UPI0023627DA7|nr:hypothetical protein [Nostoc sp. UHCC 0926]WDD36422.1 hypothetical protein PQG02_35230 [Nostoc sp. UHCC 0926]
MEPNIKSSSHSNHSQEQNLGSVLSVQSSIIDIHFPKRLPDIHTQLQALKTGNIAIEVVRSADNGRIFPRSLYMIGSGD